MRLYVLKQIGFGVIVYNQNKEQIMEKYNEETDNDRYAGYFIHEVEISENFANMNVVDGFQYINSLCNYDNRVCINE